MSKQRNTARLAVLAMTAALAGCAPTTPYWDSSFGNSTRASIAAQIANPAAARNRNPAAGLDGPAARAAQQRYQKSFEAPAAQKSVMGAGGTR